MMAKKNIFCIIFIFLFVICFNIKVLAISDIIASGDEFLEKGNSVGEVIQISQLRDVSNFFYKVFLAVGIAVAIIYGLVIGIKYIYEGAEGQAKLKEAFIPYIIGCFIVFSAFPIWKLVINFGNDFGGLDDRKENEYGFSEYDYANYEIYLKVEAYLNNKAGAVVPDAIEYKLAWTYVTEKAFGEKQSSAKVFSNTWGGDGIEPKIYIKYLEECATNEEIKQEFNNLINYLEIFSSFKIKSKEPEDIIEDLLDYSREFKNNKNLPNIYVSQFCNLYKKACGI